MVEQLCFDCKQPLRAVALFFGDVPGWACQCRWSTLTRAEYKTMFGFAFKRVPLPNVIKGGVYSGNAKQRRKQRRVQVALFRREQNAL